MPLSPPTTLDQDLLKPFDASGHSIPKLACSTNSVELRVKGDVSRIDFDYRQRLLIAQHNDKVFGDWSAWRLDTWEPATNDWRLDLTFVGTHQLTQALGKNLEITTQIVDATGALHGRYLHIKINEPVRAFDLNQKEIHLIWDVEHREWRSGVVVGNFFAFPQYWASVRHLVMQQAFQTLRIIPISPGQHGDFTSAPFTSEITNRDPQFGPDDQYVVAMGGPVLEKGVMTKPLTVGGYSPNSARPVWERTYREFPFVATGESWAIYGMTLTDQNQLLGLVSIQETSSNRLQLCDLVTGQALGSAWNTETKITGYHSPAGRRALVAYNREPKLFEVCQLGSPDPVLLTLPQPDAICLSPDTQFLAMFYKEESIIRVYTFIEEQSNLNLVQLPNSPAAAPVNRSAVAIKSGAAPTSTSHEGDDSKKTPRAAVAAITRFQFEAMSNTGEMKSGTIDASSAEEAFAKIRERGCFVTKLAPLENASHHVRDGGSESHVEQDQSIGQETVRSDRKAGCLFFGAASVLALWAGIELTTHIRLLIAGQHVEAVVTGVLDE